MKPQGALGRGLAPDPKGPWFAISVKSQLFLHHLTRKDELLKMKYVLSALVSMVILSACATQMSDEELRSVIRSEVLLAIEEQRAQLVGPEGLQGLVGERGIQGEPGLQGEGGLRGESGVQGEKGNPGETGLKGDKGEPGSDIVFDSASTLPALTVEGLTVTDQNGNPIIHLGPSSRFIGPELTMTVPGAPGPTVNLVAKGVGSSIRFGDSSSGDGSAALIGFLEGNSVIKLENTVGSGIVLNFDSSGVSRMTIRGPEGIRVLIAGPDEFGDERIFLIDGKGNLDWSAP